MALRADELERRHGSELARPPFSGAKSPYLLAKLLKDAGIVTTYPAVRTWWASYRKASTSILFLLAMRGSSNYVYNIVVSTKD